MFSLFIIIGGCAPALWASSRFVRGRLRVRIMLRYSLPIIAQGGLMLAGVEEYVALRVSFPLMFLVLFLPNIVAIAAHWAERRGYYRATSWLWLVLSILMPDDPHTRGLFGTYQALHHLQSGRPDTARELLLEQARSPLPIPAWRANYYHARLFGTPEEIAVSTTSVPTDTLPVLALAARVETLALLGRSNELLPLYRDERQTLNRFPNVAARQIIRLNIVAALGKVAVVDDFALRTAVLLPERDRAYYQATARLRAGNASFSEIEEHLDRLRVSSAGKINLILFARIRQIDADIAELPFATPTGPSTVEAEAILDDLMEDFRRDSPSPSPVGFPKASVSIAAIILLLSALDLVAGPQLRAMRISVIAGQPVTEWWKVLVNPLVPSDYFGLTLLNAFTLISIGTSVEKIIGSRRFLNLVLMTAYVGAVVAMAATYMAPVFRGPVQHWSGISPVSVAVCAYGLVIGCRRMRLRQGRNLLLIAMSFSYGIISAFACVLGYFSGLSAALVAGVIGLLMGLRFNLQQTRGFVVNSAIVPLTQSPPVAKPVPETPLT